MRTRNLPLLLLLLLAAGLPRPTAADELIFLDGTTTKAPVRQITSDDEVVYGPKGERADLQNLRRIRRDIEPKAPPGNPARLHLLGGGTMPAKSISLGNETFHVRRLDGGDWQVPMRFVRAVRLPTGKEESPDADRQFAETLESDLRGDRALARAGGKIRAVRCGVVALDNRRLTVEYGGEQRSIPRNRLVGIVLAATTRPPDRTGHCRITTRHGSTLWGRVTKLENGTLHLEAFPNHQVQIPWNRIVSLEVRSERMVYVSDLDPVSVQQGAIVTHPWSYQRDRNVLGGPLRLADTEYARGLGTHAPCRLTYSIRRNYTTLAALIGIDDSTGEKGDCLFRVFGDGQKLFEKRIRGTDPPHEIQVDISNHDRITLAVAPGEDLDLADNANWCEARFIR